MAVADGYIKFDGVDGEATDEKHEKWINLLSCSWSMHNGGSLADSEGGSMGRGTASDIQIMKHMDKATTALQEKCMSGNFFKSATIEYMRAGGGAIPYLKVDMESVYITSHSFSASGDGRPVESLTLSCAKITETYTEQDNKGEKKSTSIMEYDFQKHKGE